MPTIIYWLVAASLHSTDIHGYSLFHSKAVIGKESAPKAICGVRGRHLRAWLLCLPIFNRNNAVSSHRVLMLVFSLVKRIGPYVIR